MAGDDVERKKPDPLIYRLAAERLEVDPADCLVIEDSTIGLQAWPYAIYWRLSLLFSSACNQDFCSNITWGSR